MGVGDRAAVLAFLQQNPMENLSLAEQRARMDTLPLASLLHADLRGQPPLLIQAGTEEALYDDTVGLKAHIE